MAVEVGSDPKLEIAHALSGKVVREAKTLPHRPEAAELF